jgi:hypothetical protein
VIRACRGYLNEIRGFTFITRPNCGFIEGIDACKDGTYYSPVKENCRSKGIAYAQFATKVKSPWNVYGVKAPAFSRPISARQNTSVNYRAEYDVPGQKHTAQPVRTPDGWGILPAGCVAPQDTFGGNCKNDNQTENEHGHTVCGSADDVREDARKWRKRFHKERKNPEKILPPK